MAEVLNQTTSLASSLVAYVQRCVFCFSHNLKIRRGIVKRIAVDVMDVLFRCQASFEEPFHDETMFGFVMTLPNHDVTIAVLDVDASENLTPYRFPISTTKRIMILTQTFCKWFGQATIDRARLGLSVRFRGNKRVSVPREAMVVHSAHSLDFGGAVAICNRA